MKLSEAYAIVVLQRSDDAKQIIAHIAGWGESADAHHLTQPHPQGDGALSAMRSALARAKISPSDLSLIAAHATGTPDNDASEAAALKSLLSDHSRDVPVVGFKSHLGHTLGGAGAAELILSALALRDQIIPATANVSPDSVEYPDLLVTHSKPMLARLRYTLNTSLGFGGANTCVVLAKPDVIQVHDRSPRERSNLRRVVITGIGVVLPGMIGNAAFSQHVRSHSRFDPTRTLVDAEFEHLLSARRTRRMSAYVKMTLAAVALACADGNLVAPFEAACVLGTMHGSAGFSFDYYGQIVREGMLAANPSLFAEGVPNAAAAQLSLMLGLKQSAQTIIGTRTAGLDALRMAAMRIASGATDRAIVSAGEERDVTVDNAYTRCGLRAAQPGDAGFWTSAGAIALVLESDSAASARGASVYATVDGSLSASGTRDKIVETIARVVLPGDVIVGSSNRTWIDRAESLALRKREHTGKVLNFHDLVGELFSAGPLASIAAVLLTTQTPSFTAICTDFAGLATSVRLERA